eukprot:5161139-Prorocentrum_lima.AAC.1
MVRASWCDFAIKSSASIRLERTEIWGAGKGRGDPYGFAVIAQQGAPPGDDAPPPLVPKWLRR